ncbi:hypothetical protein GG344DRAFT_31108, partial [Lentinula edodes]
ITLLMQCYSQNAAIFEPEEAQILQSSLPVMILDIRALYEQHIEASHSGRPEVVFTEYTGRPGRPHTVINPDFLCFAYHRCTTTGLSHFLDVPRSTLQCCLLEHGIASPGTNPSASTESSMRVDSTIHSRDTDELLDPEVPLPVQLPDDIHGYSRLITGLRASNNNHGQTVLSLFLTA